MNYFLTPNIKTKDTKSAIIDTLSEKWPLTTKEIYALLKKRNSSTITYQAVHKVLNELVLQEVIVKDERKYSLNENWIKSSKEQFIRLENIYHRKDFDNETLPSKIVFNSYYDMYSFICNYLAQENLDTKGKPICFFDKYWWNTIILNPNQIKQLSDFTKKYEFYCVAKGGGPLDTMFMNFYKNYGMNVINNKNISAEQGEVVVGDLFIQVFYPEALRSVMNELAGPHTTLDNVDIKRAQQELVYKKNEIIILIHQDQQLADRMRNKVISYFPKKERPNNKNS